MLQLAQSLGFDLSDSFARNFEILTHLFQGVVALFTDPETHAQNFLLTRCQRLENLSRLLLQVGAYCSVYWGYCVLILDEVSEV